MYKMREGLKECLESWGYKEEIQLSELTDDTKEWLTETVEDNTYKNIIDWEQVSLQMQFGFKIYPTGWEKVFNELL